MNSSESPGRNGNSQHSMKMTRAAPPQAYAPNRSIQRCGSSRPCSSASCCRSLYTRRGSRPPDRGSVDRALCPVHSESAGRRVRAGCRRTPTRTRRRSASALGPGTWPTGDQYDPDLLARGRPPQRRRPLPLLAARGDRRRPGHAAAPVPRRDRELAARPQHRVGRPHRQRVPRGRGPHRRTPPVEPSRRDGDRPLPARPPPRRRRRRSPAGRRAGLPLIGHRQPARRGADRDGDAAGARACWSSARRGRG